MVRQYITIIFLVSLMAQTFSRAIMVMDYYNNITAYTKKCENKTLPAMHCNGKCQLLQKLQKEEKKDQQFPERKLENKNELTLSSKSFFAGILLFTATETDKKYHLQAVKKTVTMPRFIFHPPDLFFLPVA